MPRKSPDAQPQGLDRGLSLRVRDLHARYTHDAWALDGVCLDVAPGACLAVMGPSGSGKSTLLRCIAGLHPIDERAGGGAGGGTIEIGGREVSHLHPSRRGLAWLGQTDGLFPHLTVAANAALALRRRGLTRREILGRVRETAGPLGIADLLGRRPHQLSGGQRRRAALLRALVQRPGVLLLDEPMTGLDRGARESARAEVDRLRRALGLTLVWITHEAQDAAAVADHLLTLDRGRVESIRDAATLRASA